MDKIILICGESGSGKTTIAQMLENVYYLKNVNSYTTRPKRKDNETGHIFITNNEFDQIKHEDMVAYTEFDGYRYCATQQQIEDNDIYIVDKKGIETFQHLYKGCKKPIIFYIKTDFTIRKNRMLKRGDSINKVLQRLENDKLVFQDIENCVDYIIDNNNENLLNLIKNIWNIYIK